MEKIYCCEEDYDMAIDDFIIEHETFPVMEVDRNHKCHYCEESSAYVMRKENSEELQE